MEWTVYSRSTSIRYRAKEHVSRSSLINSTTSFSNGRCRRPSISYVISSKSSQLSWQWCGIMSLSIWIDRIVAFAVYYWSNVTQIFFNTVKVRRTMKSTPFLLLLLPLRTGDCHDSDDPIFNVTSCPHLIAPDAVLYTLHRSKFRSPSRERERRVFRSDNSKSERCPIQPPYELNQLIKDGTVCHGQSISLFYINQCASNDQFHLYLPPCLSYHRTLG